MTLSQPSPERPMNLYPGLDDELNEAYARNRAQGIVSPEDAALAGLASIVQHNLSQQSEISLSEEVQRWVIGELNGTGDNGVLRKWLRYTSLIPVSTSHLDIRSDSKLIKTYNHLYEAKLALDASPETTPSGERIGKTMHLVAVPWQAFKDHIERLPEWLTEMRRRQGINEDDYINDDLLEAITTGTPMYKLWDNPGVMYTAHEYLDYKISQDGPWGIVLMQTSNKAGIDSWAFQSPDDLTSHGTCTPLLEGQPVGYMGFLEWLALTLQENPKQLSNEDFSWLPANRLTVDGDPQVPFGNWGDNQVGLGLSRADDQDIFMRSRLAVM